MRKIEVCLCPELLDQYDLKGKIAVVTDVLRATSTMVSAFNSGVKDIRPVISVELAEDYLNKEDTIVAGERNGVKIKSFHLGNSPLLMKDKRAEIEGKHLVMTTTNGTRAIAACLDADEILIGAFLNLDTVVSHLKDSDKDVIVVCAGWKGRVNMEDSMFGGAVASRLRSQCELANDSAILTADAFDSYNGKLFDAISEASHCKRLAHHGVEDDIIYCMEGEQINILPYLKKDVIVRM